MTEMPTTPPHTHDLVRILQSLERWARADEQDATFTYVEATPETRRGFSEAQQQVLNMIQDDDGIDISSLLNIDLQGSN